MSRPSAQRIAARYHEAGATEWLQWIVQPWDVLKKQYKSFVTGPIDDTVDDIFRTVAPKLVKEIVEQEVDEDVQEYLEGAQEGRFEALGDLLPDPEPGMSHDYNMGYQWGYENASDWNGRDLPPAVKRVVVQQQLQEFRGEITEQVVIAALEKAWATVNPREIFMTVMRAVRQHGWKIGLVYGIGEIIENLVIPAALSALTGVPVPPGSLAWLPLNDLVFAALVKRLGRADAVDDFDEDGHLDWYEARFGPVRVAALRQADKPVFDRLDKKRQRIPGNLLEELEMRTASRTASPAWEPMGSGAMLRAVVAIGDTAGQYEITPGGESTYAVVFRPRDSDTVEQIGSESDAMAARRLAERHFRTL